MPLQIFLKISKNPNKSIAILICKESSNRAEGRVVNLLSDFFQKHSGLTTIFFHFWNKESKPGEMGGWGVGFWG